MGSSGFEVTYGTFSSASATYSRGDPQPVIRSTLPASKFRHSFMLAVEAMLLTLPSFNRLLNAF